VAGSRFTNPGPYPRPNPRGPLLERCERVRNREELAELLPPPTLAEHEAFARSVGLRAGAGAATPFATPREAPWLRGYRESAYGTQAPEEMGVDPERTPFRLFYSAGLQSDLAELPLGVTAIGVDLPLTSGNVEFDEDGTIVGVARDGSRLAELAETLHDRPANLFLDNGAFRRRGRSPLTPKDSYLYLERAEALLAELEDGGCCTLLLVVPDAVGDPAATVDLRNNRDVMGWYWHLASRGAYLMWPIQTSPDDLEVEVQLDQLGEQMDALAPTWEPFAVQGRVVIGVPSAASAVDPRTVGVIAWRAAQLGAGWPETPISWFHFLGTSRSRKQKGAWTLGELAEPVVEVYEWLSENEEFAVPTEPILTSDSTRAVTTATALSGRSPRREVIAEQAVAGLRSGMVSAAPSPQMALFNPDDEWEEEYPRHPVPPEGWEPSTPKPAAGPWSDEKWRRMMFYAATTPSFVVEGREQRQAEEASSDLAEFRWQLKPLVIALRFAKGELGRSRWMRLGPSYDQYGKEITDPSDENVEGLLRIATWKLRQLIKDGFDMDQAGVFKGRRLLARIGWEEL
jgi:hypothetical protein